MKPSKSLTSIVSQQPNGSNPNQRRQPKPPEPKSDRQPFQERQQAQSQQLQSSNSSPTSPICRCRVMYLGSAVPHITKDGLQGIQEPLRELYPDRASLNTGNAGIDSWLSVWSNGILIENVDETGRELKRFFKIEALHYCAAVKYVPQVFAAAANINGTATLPHNLATLPKFLPLDSPHARMQQDTGSNPPIFASILRRTTGVKVLECHAFICKREAAANALVRCCFHAYADTMYAKQIGTEVSPSVNGKHQLEMNGGNEASRQNGNQRQAQRGAEPISAARRSKSIAALNDVAESDLQQQKQRDYIDALSQQEAPMRRKSLSHGLQQTNHLADMNDDSVSQRQSSYETNYGNLQRQTKQFSKSMHHLDQVMQDRAHEHFLPPDHVNLAHETLVFPRNPYASRVPSYPPQNIIDQQQQMQSINGGTLRSVKSMAANSIASTLLRSKKHAKAMSMAQLNQQQQQHEVMMTNQPMSFHQHQQQQTNSAFMTMPPVPPMFMPRANISGSQTMKLPNRHLLQAVPPMPMNFEAMTPKEMKKLLKKSAKYGLDPKKYALPLLPLLPMQMPPVPIPDQQQAVNGFFGPPPPPLGSESGTFNPEFMQDLHQSQLSNQMAPLDAADFAGLPTVIDPANGLPQQQQPIKSILVKPNPDFLKSKAGKKWLKQQKEFKKLLPAHLDGLPIVFGPPPLDALESAAGPALPPPGSTMNGPPTHSFIHASSHLGPPPPPSNMGPGGVPMLDSNGFYNPHALYGPSGRASAASTLLRNSPQVVHHFNQHPHRHHQQQQHLLDEQMDYLQRSQLQHHQSMYSNPVPMMGPNRSIQAPVPPPLPPMVPPHQSQSLGDDQYSRHFQSTEPARRKRRNHMVEQSVISLDDEDNEDGEQTNGEVENDYERAYVKHDHDRSQRNGFYNRIEGESTSMGLSDHARPRRKEKASNGYEHSGNHQSDYEQITQKPQSEDCNSNSSGIYRRRGHINERAFSYSIRQEASKSSADNSDAEYRTGEINESPNYQHSNNNHIEYHNGVHYDNPKQANLYQSMQSVQHHDKKQHPSARHHQHWQQEQQPVDELTARLENQLNMKSFANSCVQ